MVFLVWYGRYENIVLIVGIGFGVVKSMFCGVVLVC